MDCGRQKDSPPRRISCPPLCSVCVGVTIHLQTRFRRGLWMSPIDTKVPNAAWLHILLGVLLVAVTGAVYWQVHDFELLNNDDIKYITLNSRVPQGFTWDNIRWALTTGFFSNWHPVTWLSYFADVELYGMYAGGFHGTNLQFHLMATLLLFFALSSMTRAVWASAMVAFLFAMHPLHVESVAWVSERKDVLCGAFMMLSLLAYGWYARRPHWGKYVLVAIAFALGLMSKPMLVTLPCVLLLLDYWPLNRLQPGTILRRVYEKVPLFAMSAASSVVTYLVQEHGGAMEKFDRLATLYRVANAALAYVAYLGKTFWPARLAPFYPHPGELVSLTAAASASVVLMGITLLAFASRRRHPYLIVGWLWYLGMLIPVIGLVQVGAQGMADRYTYLPLIGVFIAVVWLAQSILQRLRHGTSVAVALTAVLVVALSIATSVQTSRWRDGITLYRHAVAVTRPNPITYNLLGNALALKSRTVEAIPYFEKALAIDPDHANAHFGLAIASQELGDLDTAVAHYHETLRIDPNQLRARYKLGEALFLSRDYEAAAQAFQTVLSTEPRYMEAYNGLGMTLAARGDFQAAAEQYVRALDIRHDYVDALLNLAVALVNLGQTERALQPLNDALRALPHHAPTHMYLGLVQERLGHSDRARTHLQQALRLDPSLAPAHAALERLEAFP